MAINKFLITTVKGGVNKCKLESPEKHMSQAKNGVISTIFQLVFFIFYCATSSQKSLF